MVHELTFKGLLFRSPDARIWIPVELDFTHLAYDPDLESDDPSGLGCWHWFTGHLNGPLYSSNRDQVILLGLASTGRFLLSRLNLGLHIQTAREAEDRQLKLTREQRIYHAALQVTPHRQYMVRFQQFESLLYRNPELRSALDPLW